MNYHEKFLKIAPQTFFPLLSIDDQSYIREIAEHYLFTLQELRIVSEIARDLSMWGEVELPELWSGFEEEFSNKDKIIKALDQRIDKLRNAAKRYGQLKLPTKEEQHLELCHSEKPIHGACPVFSDKTVCCGLKTIDAVKNCCFGCSYCTIQTFYGEDNAIKFDDNLKEKLSKIEIDPDKFYHFGTGQSSDSLAFGNFNNLLGDLCEFAVAHPNILLEFKTKSANVDYFLENDVPKNIVCSWSLNTETIVKNEEFFTATLAERLLAAKKVAERGVRVSFHFHPMVYYSGYVEEYKNLAERVMQEFQPEQIAFISFGTLTFIKPVVHEIRKRGWNTKILEMPFAPDPLGKMTYPDEIKLALFRNIYGAFSDWHEKVYFYLCMEKAEIWDALFGWHYQSNDEFLEDFGRKTLSQVRLMCYTKG